jgi:hypothetical protein
LGDREHDLSANGRHQRIVLIFPDRDLVHIAGVQTELPNTKPVSSLGFGLWRSQMAAIAKVLSRVSGTEVDVETLRIIAMFCGVGLLVSLLLVSYGLDLSGGFF